MRSYAVPFLRHECLRDPSLTMFARDDSNCKMSTGKSACATLMHATFLSAREARIGDPGSCATCARLNAGATQTDALKTKDAGLKAAAKSAVTLLTPRSS